MNECKPLQPGVNASPYGNSLAMPAPMASPATSGPPLQKMSLLGGGSPFNAHVAFPVRTLTPRSPWLSSRGGLTPRMKPRGKSASPSPGGGDTGDYSSRTAASLGGDGGSPAQMATAGNWIFKPRESPRSLFIRPEPAAPPSLASLVAISPANGAYLNGGGSDAAGGSGGYRGGVGKHSGTPERRHVHFDDDVADESPSSARKTTDGGGNISGVHGSAKTQDVLPVISTNDEGYSMEPSQEVMRMLVEEKGDQVLASMEDFIVTRENFGSVKWLEPVDVRNLEIDRVVRIEHGVIYVYHENCGVPSPPPGRVVQVDPMKPKLKPPGTKRLKLERAILLSNSAFKFNLRRYTQARG